MKRYLSKALSLMLVFAMLASMFCLPTSAALIKEGTNGKTIYLSTRATATKSGAEVSSVAQNNNFVLEVNFANNPTVLAESVQSYDLFVGYDSTKMTVVNILPGLTVPTANKSYATGVIKASWGSTDGIFALNETTYENDIQSSGTLFYIVFNATADLTAEDLASFTFPATGEGSEVAKMGAFTLVQAPALEVADVTSGVYTSADAAAIKAALTSATYIDATGASAEVKGEDGLMITLPQGGKLTAGDNTCTATYNGVSTTFKVTATAVAVSGLEVTTQPKLDYISGDSLNLSGMVVKATFNDGTVDSAFTGYTASPAADTALTVAANNGKPVTLTANGTNVTVNTNNLTVAKKSVTAPTATGTYTYNGNEQTFSYTDTDAAFYNVTGSVKGTNAGEYTATVTLKDTDEAGWASEFGGKLMWTIAPKTVESATVTVTPSSYEYTGSAITPTSVVVKDSGTVIPASEYTLEYSNNTNYGTATVTVSDAAGGNYTVSGTGSFYITKKVPAYTAPTAQTLTYTGKAQDLVTGGSTTDGTIWFSTTNGDDYSTTIPQGTDAGDYTVWYKVVGDANHSNVDPVQVDVKIGKAPLTATYAGETVTFGSAPVLTVSVTGFKNGETAANAADYKAPTLTNTNTDVGSYQLTPTGGSAKNYEFTTYTPGTLTINPKEVTNPTFEGINSQGYEYTASAIEPTFTLKDGSTVIPATEYTVEYQLNFDVTNAAAITITDKVGGNYEVSGGTTFKITPHNIDGKTAYVTNVAAQNVVTGLGTFTKPTFTDTRPTAGNQIGDADDIKYCEGATYNDGSAVTYNEMKTVLAAKSKGTTGTISWKFAPRTPNYSGTLSGTISYTMVDIEFKVGSVAATADNTFQSAKESPVYGDTWATILGSQAALTAKVDSATDSTAANFTIKVDDSAYDASAVPAAGDHVVTVVYNGTVGGKTYTDVTAVTKNVNVATKALTVTADAKTVTYGDAAPEYTVTYSGFVNSETSAALGGTLAFDCSYARNSAKGAYDITPKGLTSTNYAITFTKNTLTVNAKTLTDAMVTVGGPLNYTAVEQTVPVTVTDSDATITSGDYDITDNKATNVGTYTVTVTAKGNYTGTVTKQWVMDKAAQPTALNFTSGIADKTYGDAAFDVVVGGGDGTGAYSVASSNTSVLSVAQKDNTTFTVTVVAAGKAKLTVSKAGDSNYADATPVESAEITVVPKELTKPTATGASYTYNGTTQTFTMNGFDETTMTVTGNVQTNANTTGYDVTVALKDKVNYKWSDGTADVVLKFVIAKANRKLSVTDPTAPITLYPTNLTKQITASTDTDLDHSAVITYTSNKTAAVTVNKDGLVTAVGNGSATITVSIAATDNYNAATPVTFTASAFAEPVVGVTSGENQSASINGTKIIVSGTKASEETPVTVTLKLADPSFEQVNGENKIDVKYSPASAVVATYTLDVSNVIVIPAGVTVESEAKTTSIAAGIDSAVETALTDPATKVEDLNEAVPSIIKNAASNLPEGATKVDVTMSLKIEATGYAAGQSLTLKLTPQVTYVYKNDGGASVGEAKTDTISNSNIKAPIEISIKLPGGFLDEHLFAKHELGNGKFEYLPVTVVGGVATWYQSSFSSVSLIVDSRTATVNFTKDDGSVQTVIFTPADIGSAFPTDSKSGYTFNGWKLYEGDTLVGSGKTLDDTLLSTLDGKTITAKPDFTQQGGGYIGGGGGGSASLGITVSKAQNGTVSTDVSTAKAGNTVTLTVTPDKGFTLDTLTVTDKNGKNVTLKKVSDTKYTFTMPDGKVSIAATFVESKTETAMSFTDVVTNDWYYDAIKYAFDNGLMNGTGDGKFSPNATTTRGMIFTILARNAGVDTTGSGNLWYTAGMNWAKEQGISDGTRPEGNVTREELATMLYRYALLKGVDTKKYTENTNTLSHTDVFTISDWASEGMHFCIAAGVIGGDTNGMLNPTNKATRAEVATMLMRFLEQVK